jgi:hypothetical protein
VPLSLTEFTPPHNQTARGRLDRGTISRIALLYERAVAKAHSSLPTDFGDLIAWTPKRAAADSNNSGIGVVNF